MLLNNQVNAVFIFMGVIQDNIFGGKWLLWVNILNSFSFNSSHYYCESVIVFCDFFFFFTL